MSWFFGTSSNKFLGIDIGTYSIKVVELSKTKNKFNLENYGEIIIGGEGEELIESLERGTPFLNEAETAEVINMILHKARISTKNTFFSISDFSTFFTTLKFPQMKKEELKSAIQYEARQHIPLPLSEVVLDWAVVSKSSQKNIGYNKILLVAIPHDVVNQYQIIAKKCHIKVLSLEAEVFSLARSVAKKEKGVVVLIDTGYQSTTLNIVENGSLQMTHSFDFSSQGLTNAINKSLKVDYNEAENLKKKYGIKDPEIPVGRVLEPFVELLSSEINRFIISFKKSDKKDVQKIILTGGTALLPGLKEFLVGRFNLPVEIGNPFKEMNFNSNLQKTIEEIGPSYAIAVGLAMKGFEK